MKSIFQVLKSNINDWNVDYNCDFGLTKQIRKKTKEKQKIQFINRRSNTVIQYQLCHLAADGLPLINK